MLNIDKETNKKIYARQNKLTYGTRRVNKRMSLEISLIITNCFLNTASLFPAVEDKDSSSVALDWRQDQVKCACPEW